MAAINLPVGHSKVALRNDFSLWLTLCIKWSRLVSVLIGGLQWKKCYRLIAVPPLTALNLVSIDLCVHAPKIQRKGSFTHQER